MQRLPISAQSGIMQRNWSQKADVLPKVVNGRSVLVTAVRPCPSMRQAEVPATVPPNFRNAHEAAGSQMLRDREVLAD